MASVMEEVQELRAKEEQRSGVAKELRRSVGIAVGLALYTVGVNLFLRPLHLYSGGMMGFSQLISNQLQLHTGLHASFDLAGLIYYLMNIPLLIRAYRTMRKRFVIKTVITVTLMTILLTIVPIPEETILDERLANCLAAAVIVGMGDGIILRMGSCAGGGDLLGMLLIHNRSSFSVGRVGIAMNTVLYSICMVVYDIPTALYSLIYSLICATTCDRFHTQNINVQALIITKLADPSQLEIEIMGQMGRGLTRWHAQGSYTGEQETILMAVISKYEITQLKHIVHKLDPHAFVMIDEGVGVDGHFVKKVT